MTEPEAEVRRMFTTVSRRMKLVPVPFPPGWLQVPRWNDKHESKEHTLTGADLDMPGGRPFGSLWYEHRPTGKKMRVGVRWDVVTETIECQYLQDTKPVPGRDRDVVDAAAAEMDARARLAALMSVNAYIGAQILSEEMENAILDAAGLGLDRTGTSQMKRPAPAGGTAEPADRTDNQHEGLETGAAIITGLRQGEGALIIDTLNRPDLFEWSDAGVDLTLEDGHPFGVVNYQHKATRGLLRVGVRWEPNEFQLEFVALHPTEPRLSDLTVGVEDAVRDARARVGHMLAVHAQIAEIVTGPESVSQILAASGFGGDIEYVLEDGPS